MNLRQLRERHTGLVAEMRGILDGADDDLDTEHEVRFDGLKAEIDKVEHSIARQQYFDDIDRRANGQQLTGSGDDRFDAALKGFSLRKAILSQIPGHSEDTSRERELSAELQRRSGRPFEGVAVPMSLFQIEPRVMSSDASGTYIIPPDYRPGEFIDLLRSVLITRRLGARILTGLQGNVSIPRLAGSVRTGWVAENEALTPSDQEYTSIGLSPKHAGGVAEYSRNMLLQSSPDIEQLLRQDFAAVLARAIDLGAIAGPGDGKQPEGLLTAIAPTTPAGPTWDHVLRLIEAIELGNATASGWLTHPSVVRLLRGTQVVTGDIPTFLMESPTALAGYPLIASTLVPGSSGGVHPLVFGNWSDLIIGYWSEIDILVNPYESAAYSKGNVLIRAMSTCDVAIRHEESFVWENLTT